MSLSFRSEEYYKKFIELQEKLRKSEEERLKLEMKFNEMVQTTREEKQHHYRKLRWKYKKFLEEDRLRQDRNERIVRTLERIENRIVMIKAKTDRCKLLRQQYKMFINRINETPRGETKECFPKAAPVQQSSTKPSPKDDLVEAYIRNMSSAKLRNYFENQDEEIQEKPSDSYLYDVPNRPNYTNEIADDIIHSLSSPRNKKPAESVKSPQSTATDQSEFDVQSFANLTLQEPNIEKLTQKVELPELELNHIYKQENSNLPKQFEEETKANKIQLTNDEETIQETKIELIEKDEENTRKIDIGKEDLTASKENPLKETDQIIEEMLQQKSDINLEKTLSDELKIVTKELTPELIEEPIVIDNTENEKSQLELEDPIRDESVSNKLEEMFEKKVPLEQPSEKIYEDEIQPSKDQSYPADQYEQNQYLGYDQNGQVIQPYDQTGQYDENNQLILQYDEHGQVIQYDANGQQFLPQYDENGQYLNPYEGQYAEQYDENGQLIMQYDETGQPIQHYDENGQPFDHYDEAGQPVQYDETGQPIQHYDESGQPFQHYDEAGQPVQYDETGQPIQQYDETGQPIQHYDESGQPFQHYDETGHSIQHNNETGRFNQNYDETGQPIQLYDESGQPTQNYDESGHLIQRNDESGLVQQNDEHAQAVQQYDETGQPMQQYTELQYNQTMQNDDNRIDDPQQDVVVQNIESVQIAETGHQVIEQSCEEISQQEIQHQNTTEKPIVDQTDHSQPVQQNAEDEERSLVIEAQEPIQANVMDMLDTDTESVKQDTKVSNDSDFDFSNA